MEVTVEAVLRDESGSAASVAWDLSCGEGLDLTWDRELGVTLAKACGMQKHVSSNLQVGGYLITEPTAQWGP